MYYMCIFIYIYTHEFISTAQRVRAAGWGQGAGGILHAAADLVISTNSQYVYYIYAYIILCIYIYIYTYVFILYAKLYS